MKAGQPLRRTQAWTWCVKGKGNRHAADNAVLTPGGRVALVSSNAHGESAGGVAVGDSANLLPASARPLGGSTYRVDRAGLTFVYAVRRDAVKTVAVADGAATSGELVHYLSLARSHATRRPSQVIGGAKDKVTNGNATPLVVHQNGGQFPFFCGL
jgi:hypothetical protein